MLETQRTQEIQNSRHNGRSARIVTGSVFAFRATLRHRISYVCCVLFCVRSGVAKNFN